MQAFLLIFLISIAYLAIGAYATTNINRLLSGATIPVWDKHCYCAACGHILALTDQIPVYSYYHNHGKCRYCKTSVPFRDLLPELFIPAYMLAVTLISHFSIYGYLACIAGYEIYKYIMLVLYGTRRKHFIKNLLVSELMSCFLFVLVGFFFLCAGSI